MLDVSLERVSFSYGGEFALDGVSIEAPKSTHTALVGPPGCGASTLLRLIAGSIRPRAGEVRIGSRVVNDLKPARRPLIFVTSDCGVPGRWSVRHALIAAVRQRSLDRVDRQRELDLAVEKWELGPVLDRNVGSLSSTEATIVNLARIELLRPGIVLADRLLERVNPARLDRTLDEIYRTFRVLGTTVISAPSSFEELGVTDQVVVLDGGRVVQSGSAAHVYAAPATEAAAMATGRTNVIPLSIRGTLVESAIGPWDMDHPPFQGSGVALARPEAFEIARAGEDSDLIFSIEEASFEGGRWILSGFVTGALVLRIAAPPGTAVHKGKVVAVRYDPARFRLVPREIEMPRMSVPASMIPAMKDSR